MSFRAEIPSPLARCADRPVAIFGMGVSGRAVAALCDHLGWAWAGYDEREGEQVRRTFGAADAAACGVVVYSPGFRLDHPWLALARRAGRLCLGELDFSALFWTGPTVAITGTNGKTTLTEFLAFALKRNGRDAVACGNNGYPLAALHQIESGHPLTAVVEVSSFQAESLQHFAPQAVLWTNFDIDHLDRHGDEAGYFLAKLRLVERASGPVFAGVTVAESAARLGLALPAAVSTVGRERVADWEMPETSAFATSLQRENLALAAAWYQTLDANTEKGLAELRGAAEVFTRRQHRLSFVSEVDGVAYWNDSKGTNFLATRAALDEFKGRRIHWIGGGRSKGGELAGFAAAITSRVTTAHLFGETAPELAAALAQQACTAAVYPSLDSAVEGAASAATAGDVVLLSPGFASFDQFRNYADRGLAFERRVHHRKASAALQTQLTS